MYGERGAAARETVKHGTSISRVFTHEEYHRDRMRTLEQH